MIKAVRTYLKEECPYFAGKDIGINFLSAKPGEYSLEAVPAEPVLKRYTDGGYLGQFLFVLASRELYGAENSVQEGACDFYESVSAWMEKATREGTLPTLSDGCRAVSLSVTSGGYLMSNQSDRARYQMQCRLIFEKEGVFYV